MGVAGREGEGVARQNRGRGVKDARLEREVEGSGGRRVERIQATPRISRKRRGKANQRERKKKKKASEKQARKGAERASEGNAEKARERKLFLSWISHVGKGGDEGEGGRGIDLKDVRYRK